MEKYKFLVTIILYFYASKSNAQNKMHITEQLLNGTIRIEAINGTQVSTGTGFFFRHGWQFPSTAHVGSFAKLPTEAQAGLTRFV
jgi:hypothetical protein